MYEQYEDKIEIESVGKISKLVRWFVSVVINFFQAASHVGKLPGPVSPFKRTCNLVYLYYILFVLSESALMQVSKRCVFGPLSF